MKTNPRNPRIKKLHYTAEEIAEVKRIQASTVQTKMKEQVRAVLHGPMCVICAAIPDYRIESDLDGILRVECYCSQCFENVYEKTKDIHQREQLAERWGCEIAKPGTFGGGKKEYEQDGYSTTPKSSLSDRTIICQRCRITRIFFDETQRGYNNVLVPLEYRTLKPHDCSISYPFFCNWCDTKLYHDKKIRNDNNVLIPIQFDDDVFHVCLKKGQTH